MLDESGASRSLIIDLVFDTTSLNTGLRNGIVVRLEKEFGRQLLHVPCRNYIHELLCEAATKLIYGNSKSPKEEAFAYFIAAWPKLDKSNFEVYQPSRTMLNQWERVVEFCQIVLSAEDWFRRNDYGNC